MVGRAENRHAYPSFGLVFTSALWLSLIIGARLMTVAAASSASSWLAWIALAPLFIAIWSMSLGRAAASGAIWGGSFYLFSTVAGDSVLAASLSSLVLLVAVTTGYVFLGALFTRRFGFSPLALALGWVLVELALQPLGMAHGLLAANQLEGAVPRLIANLLGYGFVAFLVSFVNALLLWMAGAVAYVVAGPRFYVRVTERVTRVAAFAPVFISAFCLQPCHPRAPPSQYGEQVRARGA